MRREFPQCPIVGVGAVVIHHGRVLLVRRGQEPLKGEWSLPGGALELGEDLTAGVRREVKEETGLDVEPVEQIATVDRVTWDGRDEGASRVRYHYVIVDYLCRLKEGELAPASDVSDARWVARDDLASYKLTETATAVIQRGFESFKKHSEPST
jgi:8-oxo-dGTP diphosphatase